MLSIALSKVVSSSSEYASWQSDDQKNPAGYPAGRSPLKRRKTMALKIKD
jgi:hypothetical protein